MQNRNAPGGRGPGGPGGPGRGRGGPRGPGEGGGDANRPGGERGRGGDRDKRRERPESDMVENVIFVNRVAKVVKGGRRFSFTALVAVGDTKSNIGIVFVLDTEVYDTCREE